MAKREESVEIITFKMTFAVTLIIKTNRIIERKYFMGAMFGDETKHIQSNHLDDIRVDLTIFENLLFTTTGR